MQQRNYSLPLEGPGMGLKSDQFSHPFILRPRPGVGRRIPGLTWVRRWRWTRKLGCSCSPPWASARVFPCRTRVVRISFLFWKLERAPRVGDHQGEIPECTLQPRRQGCPAALAGAAAFYSTTTGTAGTWHHRAAPRPSETTTFLPSWRQSKQEPRGKGLRIKYKPLPLLSGKSPHSLSTPAPRGSEKRGRKQASSWAPWGAGGMFLHLWWKEIFTRHRSYDIIVFHFNFFPGSLIFFQTNYDFSLWQAQVPYVVVSL